MLNGWVTRSPTSLGGVKATGIWAITAYFNPMRYRTKLSNYRLFRERLDLPLVTIELAYGSDYELDQYDAEILVQRRSQDVLWQKERLLNLALQALPDECRIVVWVDCDIIFESNNWILRVSKSLDRFALVQPFQTVYRMPPSWTPGQPLPLEAERRHSVPSLIASGMSESACLSVPSSQIDSAPGYAWAAGRKLLEEYALYDACIIGGGDSTILRTAYGRFRDALRLQYLNRNHYLRWAIPFYDAVKSNVAFLEGNIFHLWHGNTAHRQYRQRDKVLARCKFDPKTDIAIDQSGIWRWNSQKPELHNLVRDYFCARREDG
jgi:hypothetical protein